MRLGGLNLVDLNPPRSRCHILFDLIMDKSLDWCFSLSVHLPSRFKADVSSATNYLGIFIGTFGVLMVLETLGVEQFVC